MTGQARKQCPRLFAPECRVREAPGRTEAGQAKPGERQRVTGQVDDRAHQLRDQSVGGSDERPVRPPPGTSIVAELGCRLTDGQLEDGRPAAVERMRQRRWRMDPLDAESRKVERAEER